MSPNRLVVIGASAGGVQALQKLVAKLPADLGAPVLIVQHIGRHRSILPELLSARGPLPASHGVDGEPIRPGRIYVAPSDRHMLVDGPRIRLSHGPKEHHARPAIDPLFRSAALTRGGAVIGVVLTGMLDDGTPGLQAVKQHGGTAVVQDPRDAAEPSMPRSALRYVAVDHCLPLDAIAELLVHLIGAASVAPEAPPAAAARNAHEQSLFLAQGDVMEHLEAIGSPSTFVCPDCSGTLWELADVQPRRFRCHTGHAFTLRTLQYAQATATDTALWGAIRALQEKRMLIEGLAQQRRADGEAEQASELLAEAGKLERVTAELRGLVEAEPEPSSE